MLIKWPTRARPQLFRERFAQYRQDETAEFLITIDVDDPTMNNPAMLGWLDEQPRTTVRIGNSKSKVQACNDGLNEMPWEGIVMLASDDMAVQYDDYAKRITHLFNEIFPDGDGVLHLNDGRVGPVLNTLAIMDRKWFNRFGYVYCPAYVSLYCDQELQDVSESLGRARYVDNVIVKHCWIGENQPDDLLRRNESYYQRDGRVYEARKLEGFPTVSAREVDHSTST